LRDFEEEKLCFSSSKSLKKNIIGWEKRTKDFLHSPFRFFPIQFPSLKPGAIDVSFLQNGKNSYSISSQIDTRKIVIENDSIGFLNKLIFSPIRITYLEISLILARPKMNIQ
jgi:hypothetical protein